MTNGPGFLLELVALRAVLPVRLGPLHGAPRLCRLADPVGAVGDAAVAAEDDGRRFRLRPFLLPIGILTVDFDLRRRDLHSCVY